MFYQATALTCWDNTLRTLWSCIVFIYTYTCKRTHAHRHTHRCRRATCSALRRFFGEISQNSRCILVLKNNKRRKKKKRRASGSWYICCFLVCFFFFFFWFFLGDYRSANKQRLLNVYSVMLLYIVYYGPRQLGNQAYFKWGGEWGGGSIFKHYDDKNHKPPSTRYTSVQMDSFKKKSVPLSLVMVIARTSFTTFWPFVNQQSLDTHRHTRPYKP